MNTFHPKPIYNKVKEGAYCAAFMLTFFALMMTFGFWLRFGDWPWVFTADFGGM